MDKSYDVIVVGAGGSGLAAAVSAAEHGASVLVLEKRTQPGGTTGIAVGSFTANRTTLQRKAGILGDNADWHEEDAGQFASADIEARNNSELRRFFLSHSADTLHWLMEMGLSFHGPSPEPPNRVPRMHNVVPGAKAYIATLHARLIRLGGQLVDHALGVVLPGYCDRYCGVVMVYGQSWGWTIVKAVVLALLYILLIQPLILVTVGAGQLIDVELRTKVFESKTNPLWLSKGILGDRDDGKP